MNCLSPDRRPTGAPLDRRSLLALLAGFAGAAAAPWRGVAGPGPGASSPKVFFHQDALHLDRHGTCVPYRAPAGACSIAPLATLTETQIRRAHPYL